MLLRISNPGALFRNASDSPDDVAMLERMKPAVGGAQVVSARNGGGAGPRRRRVASSPPALAIGRPAASTWRRPQRAARRGPAGERNRRPAQAPKVWR